MKLLRFKQKLAATCIMVIALAACSEGADDSGESVRLQVEAYLEVAELYRQQGQFRASAIEAQNALQADPANLDTRLFMARVLVEMGDMQGAQEALTTLRESVSDSAEIELLLAEAELNLGRARIAEEILEALQSTDPAVDIEKNVLLGNVQATLNMNQAARQSFDRALTLEANNLDALIGLSKLEYRDGNGEAARELIDRAVAIHGDDLDLSIWRGQHAMLEEDYPAAEAAYNEALEIMGEYDTMTSKRFATLQAILVPLQMQQKNDEALRYSQIIAETPQGQFQSSLGNAISLFEEGDYQQAEAALGELLASNPDHAGSNIIMGLAQYAQGNFVAAEESLAAFVDTESSSPMEIKTLAATQIRLNQGERAVSTLQEAIQLYPEDGTLYAMLGLAQQSIGAAEDAVSTFQRGIELLPDSAPISFGLAASYYSLGQVEASIEELQRTISLDRNLPDARQTLVRAYIETDQLPLARESVQGWLNDEPGSVEVTIIAGQVAMAEQNLQEARQMFESLIGSGEADIVARLYLARVEVAAENYPAANSQFLAVLESQPNNAEALSGVLAVGELRGDPQSGIAAVEQQIDRNSDEFVPPLVLSQYLMTNIDMDGALRFGETAFARADNDYTRNNLVQVHVRLADLARGEQDYGTAQQHVDEALELLPQSVASLVAAVGLANDQGDSAQASAYVNELKELYPGLPLPLEVEGDLLVSQGDLEGALVAFQSSWELQASPSTGLKLFQTYTRLGRADDAQTHLSNWERMLPEDPAVNLMIGMNYQQQSQDDAAIEKYEQVLSAQPQNIVALNNLAWLYQDSRPARALELANLASELAPNDPNILDTYGWILLQQDLNEEARVVLQRAAELAPDNQEIQDHLQQASQ